MSLIFHKKVLKNIKKKMKAKKKTQLELANILKLAPSTLNSKFSRLNQGKTINLDSLYEIAQALEVEPWELLK